MAGNIFIDATDTAAGRIGTYTATAALRGNKVFVLNAKKAIMSGNKEAAIAKYKRRRAMGGSALKGPYHSKDPEKILKRVIRGMVPDHRIGRGRDAWKRIRCHNEVPEEYKDQELISIKRKLPIKFITLQELGEKL